jgi:signal transduction histidine kinase
MAVAKILIVEDDRIIALDIQNSLTTAGYEVVAIADCAPEALEFVQQFHPDLVLMDIRIRGVQDGVETADLIRREFNLPVVFLTAHADENTLHRAKITQPFGYILKPFADQELITTIEIALSRYQAETAIREALHQAQALHALKSRFVAMVSHEFRNPLNAILFSTELLQRYNDRLSPEKKENYFHRIHTAVKRMNQLMDDVLTIGEQETGNLKYNPGPLDVEKFCLDLIEELYPSEHRAQQIVFTYRDDTAVSPSSDSPPPFGRTAGPPIVALHPSPMTQPVLDDKLLRHILTNLLSNAIKYSSQGQSIAFDVVCQQNAVIFHIKDQGIGIPIEDHAQLFGAFHRASNVTGIPGSGLGLSIVKQCVDLHSGEITVQSQVNQGTTFTVTLPLPT